MITVDSRAGRYDIHIQWGALDDLGAHMRNIGLGGAAFVVSDDAVGPLFGERAITSLHAAGFEAALRTFPAGEASKNLDTVRGVYDWLLDHHAERGSTVVALGGGVVGDLAGFAAATYLRGVPLVHVPTSLLAMVDASIGGKTGVDHAKGKNLIGAFYPPRIVISDPSLLTTLPQRALRDGFAEAIKHALILDPQMLDVLEGDAARLMAIEPDLMVEFVARNAAIKASVVTQDEREGGLRMILNYGHTTAHAIEAVTGYARVMHGEADSIGMMAAAEIGRRMEITPASVGERQARVFERYSLPLRMPDIDVDAVIDAMAYDKKVASKTVRWVLLEDEGKPVIRDDVPMEIVRDVLVAILR
jgi:3-dehydroquinate synthase